MVRKEEGGRIGPVGRCGTFVEEREREEGIGGEH